MDPLDCYDTPNVCNSGDLDSLIFSDDSDTRFNCSSIKNALDIIHSLKCSFSYTMNSLDTGKLLELRATMDKFTDEEKARFDLELTTIVSEIIGSTTMDITYIKVDYIISICLILGIIRYNLLIHDQLLIRAKSRCLSWIQSGFEDIIHGNCHLITCYYYISKLKGISMLEIFDAIEEQLPKNDLLSLLKIIFELKTKSFPERSLVILCEFIECKVISHIHMQNPDVISDIVKLLKEFNMGLFCYEYYYNVIIRLLSNTKVTTIDKYYQFMSKWGEFMARLDLCPKIPRLLSKDNCNIIQEMYRLCVLQNSSEVKKFERYLVCTFGDAHKFDPRSFIDVTDHDRIDPLIYNTILELEKTEHIDNSLLKFEEINDGLKVATYPIEQYEKNLKTRPYKYRLNLSNTFHLRMPKNLLDISKKWIIPAYCQTFEIELDGSRIKCSGLYLMIINSLEKPKNLKTIHLETKISLNEIKKSIERLTFERLVIVNKSTKKYSIIDIFKPRVPIDGFIILL